MIISFYKYQGAGNDFILIDNRKKNISLSPNKIERLCHRRFGIGADGLILLEADDATDFKMVYYNADGRLSSFCGNGGRCIAHFAYHVLKITKKEMTFTAFDGRHHAIIKKDNTIALSMQPVNDIQFHADYTILDTGSPHLIKSVQNVKTLDVDTEGRTIRNNPAFKAEGINVNFLEENEKGNFLRTYERGVEAETFACGTGVTATAIALSKKNTGHFVFPVITKAGHHFWVSYDKNFPLSACNISLVGPVKKVFSGKVEV